MFRGLSGTLPRLVEAKFKTAHASADLLFSPTELAIIRTSTGIPFQLRYCPTLAKKPLPKSADATPKQKIDPFENPSPALHVVDIPAANPSHLIVLNKFPIIKHHFIIATKDNKAQTHLLEAIDLEAAYASMKSWESSDLAGGRMFAFFNSGDHSGASQPHRHIQLLPLEDMRNGDATDDWSLLIDLIISSSIAQVEGASPGVFQHPGIPFTHFGRKFESEPSADKLLRTYLELYTLAREAVERFIVANPHQLVLHSTDEGNLPISYNLAMTTNGMVILPRRAEGAMCKRDDGSEVGFVALNGTILGGTLMVKHQEEWDLLRAKPEVLDQLLVAIGIPRESSWSKSRV